MAIETPSYETIKKDGKFSIRKYSATIQASVVLPADDINQVSNTAFGLLAGYIFGDNKSKGKIAMTAPVAAEQVSEQIAMTAPVAAEQVSEQIAMTAPVDATKTSGRSYKVSFTMPSKYSMATLPKPNNDSVKIEKRPSHTMAVLSFAGYTTSDTISDKTELLQKWAKANGIDILGQPVVSRYDAPWKPGFLRHNEVSFRVKTSQ